MRVAWKWFLAGITGVACSTVLAVPPTSAEPYQKIPERNVFGLKEILPAPQPTNTEPAKPIPKVFLTGITTLGGYKRALFAVQFPSQPGQPAREESLMLAEGQRDHGIEVLSVDEIVKQVRVNNSGTEMSLNFDKDGLKQTTTSPAATSTAQVATAAGTTGAAVAPNPPTSAVTPSQMHLRRTLRLPNAEVQAPAVPVTPPPSPAALGVPATAAQQQATGTSTPVTPEEELILRALQEKR